MIEIQNNGRLTIGGVDADTLAGQYGTPLYVMDEAVIRDNCRQFTQAFAEYTGGHGGRFVSRPYYASKAFSCKEIYRIMADEGLGADVVSAGELYTALAAGFPPGDICFHGNNKSEEELVFALESGVGLIAADNLPELLTIDRLAKRSADVILRIKPGIDAHTHDFVKTGQIDSKFGFAIEYDETLNAVKTALGLNHVRLAGLHCHIGSQIFDVEPFVEAARVMLTLAADLRTTTGWTPEILNLGGGFGIRYTEEDDPTEYGVYLRGVFSEVEASAAKLNLPLSTLLMEPGRSIVGPAGVTLYRVGAKKEIPGVRTYVSIDGGMTDNPRYALYRSRYDVAVAVRAGEAKTETVTLAGKCCESGDLIGENLPIQPVEPGDVVAVFATGAYNYSMSSNYNRNPRPAVVMVKDGQSRVIVRRETPEDVARCDV